jgi:stage II sporulation protein D
MNQNIRYIFYDLKENKKLLIKGIITLIIFFFLSNNTILAKVPLLRVGIFLNYKEVVLKSEKGINIYEIPSMKTMLSHQSGNPLKVIATPFGIEIDGKQFNTAKNIRIIPESGGLIQVNGYKYRGEIEIIFEHNLLNVINIIEIEKYLYGVLKKEISPEWPDEVLKAQAIAARSFALSNMNKFADEGYNICATTNSQAYGGVNHEDPATNKAVNDTHGIILTFEGEPINAVYHSDSGGHTENSEDVWGGFIPYLRSVSSNYEEIVSPPNHQWGCSFTEEELLKKLASNGYQLNNIQDLVIADKTEAGRVQSVVIVGDNNQKITFKTNDFRLLIGPTMIRSSLFSVDINGKKTEEKMVNYDNQSISEESTEQGSAQKPVSEVLTEDRDFSIPELVELLNRSKEESVQEKKSLPKEENYISDNGTDKLVFSFRGKGNGHGVGLSQWGAYGMASQGYSYEDILKYYYQGVQLKKIY